MFVEDDVDIINMFVYVFEKSGYKAYPIQSYAEAFAACVAQAPDILIIGLLPFSPDEALGLCRELRTTITNLRFPIIMGHVDPPSSRQEEVYQNIYNAGANACFGRVYDITDVLELIEILLKNPTATGLMDRQTLQLRAQSRS